MLEVVPSELLVLKRDGVTTQPFSLPKIETAISKAWAEVTPVDDVAKKIIRSLTRKVLNTVEAMQASTPQPTSVEDVQNVVEIQLMSAKCFRVAKRYILYREEHAKLRGQRLRPDPRAIADYIHPAKYGRYLPMELRREVYLETTARVKKMHRDFFTPYLSGKCDRPDGTSPQSRVLDRMEEVFTRFVDTQRLLPSMRSMQFAGTAQLVTHARGYNCCCSYVDRPRVFQEILYLLLCGCGVGYSVQNHHVAKLPPLKRFVPDRSPVRHFTIPDTIEGWADAMGELFQSVLDGVYLEFDYHLIRAKGTPLKTSGGKAPGHLPLKKSLDAVRAILYAALGRKLTPLVARP
jgi:ribonucleoside-triphosphate reductase (thioredoxin)